MDNELKLQFINTFSALITAAFGLVAALAWNEAIKLAIAQVLGTDGTLWASIIYAVVVTVLAVLAIFVISRSAKKLADKVKKEETE